MKRADSNNEIIAQHWLKSNYAQQYFDVERRFIDAGLRQCIGPSVLQIGQKIADSVVDDFDLPFLVKTNEFLDRGFDVANNHYDIVVDPAFLPFSPNSFSTIVLPHVLERHALPHQVLREAHRTLMFEGHIVLTGFNPNSLMSLQRWLRPAAVCPGRYYSIRQVCDWLQLLGFEVVSRPMFHYAPVFSRLRLKNIFQFLELAGDRWLPRSGGGYMISAKKRDVGTIMRGHLKFNPKKLKLAAPVTVKAAAKKTS